MSFFNQSQKEGGRDAKAKGGKIFIFVLASMAVVILLLGIKVADTSLIETKTERGIVLKKDLVPDWLFSGQVSSYKIEIVIDQKPIKAEISGEIWRKISFGDEVIVTYGYGRFSNKILIKKLLKK